MVDFLLSGAALLYLVCVLLLTAYLASYVALLVVFFRTRHQPAPGAQPPQPVPPQDLPTVTVQLPVYNEALVIERLIDACAQLDYPTDRFRVQIIDDSTDHTAELIAARIAAWAARGVTNLDHLRRPHRTGYTAGALAFGLEQVTTECIAVFDADFVPAPDFLRRTMSFFAHDPDLALVQTRWAHLNPHYNLLTRAQVLTLDAHFAVEQVARNRGRFPMSMNGTGGIWRVRHLQAAGGWSSATITEDLDLSYRAVQQGMAFLYVRDVAVAGEIPPQVQAYKIQQARWATGFTECLIRHTGPLLRAPGLAWWQKIMGVLHLATYAVQPLLLIVFLLTPVLIGGGMFARLPDMRLTGFLGIVPPLVIILGQIELYRKWPQHLIYLPVQFMIGAALVLNNTRGALAGIHAPNTQREFIRTPKFNVIRREQTWRSSRYAMPFDGTTLGEILLGVYALAGLVLAARAMPAFAPYMLSYAISFFGFAGWNIWQTRQQHSP